MHKIRTVLMVMFLSLILMFSGCDLLLQFLPDKGPDSVAGLDDIEWLKEGPVVSTPENETTFYQRIGKRSPSSTVWR